MRFLIELARRHGLDGWVLFAGSDEDLRFIAQNHAALSAAFTLTTPAWDKVRGAYDKRHMNARAAELGIAQPRTHYPRSRDELNDLDIPFPVILKPTVRETRNRFVDAKAWRADDRHTLLALYDEARSLVGADSVMIQEMIPGDGAAQFSYAGVWRDGKAVGSLVARRRRQYPIDFGFTSTFVETVEQPEIEALASRFLSSLDFSGLVEIEFKFDARDGAYKILDVNARAWTWLGLGAAAGIDFPALQWRLATGETVTPVAARSGVRWRYFSRDVAAALAEMHGRQAVGTRIICARCGGRRPRRCLPGTIRGRGSPICRSAPSGSSRGGFRRGGHSAAGPAIAGAHSARRGHFVSRAAATACWNSVCIAAEISPSVVTEKNMPGDAQLCMLDEIWF